MEEEKDNLSKQNPEKKERRRKTGGTTVTPPIGSIVKDYNANFSRSIAAATPASHIINTNSFLFAVEEESKKEKIKFRDSNVDIPERVLTDIPAPPFERLNNLRILGAEQSVCEDPLDEWKVLREHLYKEGRVDKQSAHYLIDRATKHFQEQPNVLELKAPITICGDIHGQYYDLSKLLQKLGEPKDAKFLFLGDYVDRGDFSCEVCFLLLGLVVSFPENIFLLRGNHESRLITSNFNFKRECYSKYGVDVYDAFMRCFDWMPIAAVISSENEKLRYFACHGGLSPDLKFIDDINKLNRAVETPGIGLLCDLLWADPIPDDEGDELDEDDLEEWKSIDFRVNKTRGCSYEFGYAAVRKFLDTNNICSVIRAHEVKRDGYEEHFFCDESPTVPPIITVFSAPNYCDMYENKAAFLEIFTGGTYKFGQITWVSHPYWLPDFEDAFTFSVPYLVECVSQLYIDFLAVLGVDESQANEVSNIYRTYTRQRQRRERLIALKRDLLEGKNDKFIEALKIDKSNEIRPRVKKMPPQFKRAATSTW